MDIHNLSELITALQAETEHDAITPYSLGSLLRVIAALLGDAGSENAITTLQSQLNAERSARMTADTAMATDISQLSTSFAAMSRTSTGAESSFVPSLTPRQRFTLFTQSLIRALTSRCVTSITRPIMQQLG